LCRLQDNKAGKKRRRKKDVLKKRIKTGQEGIKYKEKGETNWRENIFYLV